MNLLCVTQFYVKMLNLKAGIGFLRLFWSLSYASWLSKWLKFQFLWLKYFSFVFTFFHDIPIRAIVLILLTNYSYRIREVRVRMFGRVLNLVTWFVRFCSHDHKILLLNQNMHWLDLFLHKIFFLFQVYALLFSFLQVFFWFND